MKKVKVLNVQEAKAISGGRPVQPKDVKNYDLYNVGNNLK